MARQIYLVGPNKTIGFSRSKKLVGGSLHQIKHFGVAMRASEVDASAPIRLINPRLNRKPLTLKL